ncbi:protein TolQ [Endozoicomonas sp. SM1973]|uniref:Tol-Pal system protein TolQ n=1 Tax=Spartinivicinus marinus TaxID=2994442 RepID=A0A853IFT2_9GAMM|nr:protein TolQ [Spartinivicinus marinus]MCX4028733.1 protein TolQ [Spartinivicinus marinus]NYZ68005.1 protein TolQ [Spartinivicinus marinus]
MSIWSLIAGASWIVQLVMLILLLASIVSWVMILQRGFLLSNTKRSAIAFEDRFWSGMDLSKLFRQVTSEPDPDNGMEHLFRAGFKEFTRLRQDSNADPDAVMEGTQRAMRVALAREQERLEQNLPFLATVGSISPYIGLFGTVIGIMNSFRGLANQTQATLATVAPGISEALVATAMGLLAAIPAVVAYNKYSAKVDQLLNSYDTFSDEFSSILHRKVHTRIKQG